MTRVIHKQLAGVNPSAETDGAHTVSLVCNSEHTAVETGRQVFLRFRLNTTGGYINSCVKWHRILHSRVKTDAILDQFFHVYRVYVDVRA